MKLTLSKTIKVNIFKLNKRFRFEKFVIIMLIICTM